jgi:glycosyltransferase 2 family protein
MTEDTGNGRKPSRRVRRPMDLLLTISAMCAFAVLFAVIHGLPAGSDELSSDVTRAMRAIPYWLTVGGALISLVGSFALVLLGLSALLRREARGALNAAVAAAVAAVASMMASLVWNGQHGELDRIVLHGSNPSIFVYDCAFVASLTGSDLMRRGRWTRRSVLSVTALLLLDVASRALAPLALPVALLGGLIVGWSVRWLLGTAATRLTAAQIANCLGGPDVSFRRLHETAGSAGARLSGQLGDGTRVEVLIAGRDTRGSGLAPRLWSLIRLRPVAAGPPSLSSRSRLERLALSSCLAERREVLVPRVVAMRELEADTLVLATTQPRGRHPRDGEAPEDIAQLFSALRLLHDAGVAHRDLRAQSLLLVDGAAGFSSLDSAQPGASDLVQRLDVTQLLTTAARCSSPAVAIKALREAYEPADESAIAAVLQPIALAPWGWSEMRAAKACVNEMRLELAGPDADRPETSLERFRWRTVLSAVALVAAAFILVGQLSKVDLAGTLAHASLAWCGVALVASAFGNVALPRTWRRSSRSTCPSGEAPPSSSPRPLSALRCPRP